MLYEEIKHVCYGPCCGWYKKQGGLRRRWTDSVQEDLKEKQLRKNDIWGRVKGKDLPGILILHEWDKIQKKKNYV